MIRENPASRGTETSAEVLVGPPGRMVSNAGQQQWYGGRRPPEGRPPERVSQNETAVGDLKGAKRHRPLYIAPFSVLFFLFFSLLLSK